MRTASSEAASEGGRVARHCGQLFQHTGLTKDMFKDRSDARAVQAGASSGAAGAESRVGLTICAAASRSLSA